MWLWIVVAVAAVMHAAVISDEENRRIRNAQEMECQDGISKI